MRLEKKSYKTGEVARMLGLNPVTVYLWVRKGLVKAWKTPGGQYLIPREEVERLLEEMAGE